jgi:hypothetical protein
VVTSGNFRSRAEQRKHRRQPLRYSAKIMVDGEQAAARTCTLSDVSQSGARLVLAEDEELPDQFLLLLSANGGARRRCQVIWRDGTSVGVKFALD